MSRSRYGAKFDEQAERRFEDDLENHPAAVAAAVRDLFEGAYGRDRAQEAAAARGDAVRHIYAVGVLRWALSRAAAGRAFASRPLRARERVKQLVAATVQGAPSPKALPAHAHGKQPRQAKTFTGEPGNIGTPWRIKISDKPARARSAAPPPRYSETPPAGMTAVDRGGGVYVRKL